ncbi:hypothetical protein GMOD_00010323 [Pyrenophora seminiperda CCB06]|uniref:Uncharacterized protein n=1 Tax=Pyrenophora seminiperda CCB06 TaxID=1302712 RepID=A0A3M7M5S9_9PLEO|nr:hypothetical protein GMOD_00010323 [Pyrenophora seminiperda CCB06]
MIHVESGGLAEFAAEHNKQPTFIDSIGAHGIEFIMEYYARLRSVPGLEDEICYKSGWGGRQTVSDEVADAMMAEVEGWYIDDDDDEDSHEEDEKDAKKDVKDEKNKGDMAKESAKEEDVKVEHTTVSPSDGQSEETQL